jgi:hypothetical protein
MSDSWDSTILTSAAEAFELLTELRGKAWLSRGQSTRYRTLVPSIDREWRARLCRDEKLRLERQSIDLFRASARFFAHPGEELAMGDDMTTLMVLRHYGVPTRLLDWSMSPHIAMFFAACANDADDGELWSFDERFYESVGKDQWVRWPEALRNGEFQAGVTAFSREQPPNWFICGFYQPGFPRQHAQEGVFTLTARFGRDHADAISDLLCDPTRYHLYVISAALKPELRRLLRDRHGVWRGPLFPDTGGVAETVHMLSFSAGVVGPEDLDSVSWA